MMLRLCLLLGLALGAPSARAEDGPLVFAAASLRGVLEAAVIDYDPAPRIAYGGSGALAQQIARGAPAELVILASEDWMDWLTAQGLAPRPVMLLGNRLVLVSRAGPPLQAPDAEALLGRLGGGRLAMGQRRAVPAGVYAKAWLEGIGAWSALEPHLAEAQDVRAALAFVSRGAAPVGVVYASDAQAEPGLRVIYEVPEGAHPPIRYPAAAFSAQGDALLAHLRTQSAAFEAAGFEALP
ncbi:MAG: molybdate ABC transporter substrate-binding protein [Pseudomonadota bacterium]